MSIPLLLQLPSPSPRKAWIETIDVEGFALFGMSPSPRKAWIETPLRAISPTQARSPSPRKAWIETYINRPLRVSQPVAFPPEGVD